MISDSYIFMLCKSEKITEALQILIIIFPGIDIFCCINAEKLLTEHHVCD